MRRVRRSRLHSIGLGLAMTLILGGAAAQYLTRCYNHNSARRMNTVTALMPIRYEMKQSAPAETPVLPVLVVVDTQKAPGAALPTLADTLHGVAVLPEGLPNVAGSGDLSPMPAWIRWAHLGDKRAQVQAHMPEAIGAEGLGIYAARGEWGASLCLVNKTNSRLLTTAQFRLPRGVYSIERLVLSQGSEAKPEARNWHSEGYPASFSQSSAALQVSSTANTQASTALAHLEGCDLGEMGMARKVFCLEPGQACVYRCLDSAREARAAWYDVFARLRDMGTRQPGQAHRLSVMLHEADSYLSGVSGGGRSKGRDARLECIHHLLLVTAQAHSLHHNYQMRRTVDENTGRDVFAAMDRLTVALSETSAVLLGLVPQVAIAPASQPDAQARNAVLLREQTETPNANKKENEATSPNMQARLMRTVTVSLENTGGRSVRNVKLGLNMTGMPQGATCDPADPAYFDVLHPGQSARAVFHVRCAAGADLPNTLITGDVSYFAGTAPAHLRPHAW